jgi:hypothetical protein
MSCFDIEGWRRSRRQPRQYYDLQNPFLQALAKSTPSPVRSEQEGAPTLPENFLDLSLRASSWISLTTLFAPMEKWRPSSTPPYTTLPIHAVTKPEDFGLVVSSVLTHFSRLLIILIDGQKKEQ